MSRSHSSDPGARLAHAVPAAGSHTSRGRALSRRRKGAPLGAGDEGFRRHDKRAGVPVSVPLPLLRVLVQTWRGEPATCLRARICPVNSYAAQNMPSCTGHSCDGRAGVREKAHHLHCCRPSLVRKPWPPVLDRGCWRALAPFERHRTSSICPSPGSAAAAGHRIGLSPLFPRAVSALRCAWPSKYVAENPKRFSRPTP